MILCAQNLLSKASDQKRMMVKCGGGGEMSVFSFSHRVPLLSIPKFHHSSIYINRKTPCALQNLTNNLFLFKFLTQRYEVIMQHEAPLFVQGTCDFIITKARRVAKKE